MSNPVLQVIVASTRPGRIGETIGAWVRDQANAHGKFDVQFTDLAELNLPFLDEPNHPMQRNYTKSHTLAWSETVANSDAFLFVTPEYNHSLNAPLKNAIDFLYHEWTFKPGAFVSYGGASGGMRGVQAAKLVLEAVKVFVPPESVALAFAKNQLDDGGTFRPTDANIDALNALLTELNRLAPVMKQLR